MTDPTPEQLAEIGESIYFQAIDIFEYCDRKDDFCIQSTGMESTVFGGYNRLIFRPELGWYIDKSYCSKHFIEKFIEWYKANCKYHYDLEQLIK